MQFFGRILILLAAVGGSAMLLWKAWDGMFYFLYTLITSTLDPEQEVPRFLPDHLITVLGFLLIGVSQIGATWILGPKLKSLGLLRGSLLILSSVAFLFAVSRVRAAFQMLAHSGGADPSALASQLDNTAPFFYGALGVLLLSTALGVVGTFDRSPKSGGGILKGFETAVWIVSILLMLGLTINYRGIDIMLSGGADGSADPTRLAGAISLNLSTQLAWSFFLGLLGALALAGSMLTKPARD